MNRKLYIGRKQNLCIKRFNNVWESLERVNLRPFPRSNKIAQMFWIFQWEKLKDADVWLEAAAQIFFSLSLSFGGLIAYASYNDEKNNTLKDALIISFTNCGTSIFAGIAIFSILGYRYGENSISLILLFNVVEAIRFWSHFFFFF